jgi:hypothetical protein
MFPCFLYFRKKSAIIYLICTNGLVFGMEVQWGTNWIFKSFNLTSGLKELPVSSFTVTVLNSWPFPPSGAWRQRMEKSINVKRSSTFILIDYDILLWHANAMCLPQTQLFSLPFWICGTISFRVLDLLTSLAFRPVKSAPAVKRFFISKSIPAVISKYLQIAALGQLR